MISFEQDTLWDKIFRKGRIKIILTGTETSFTFDNVAEPQKAAHMIYSYKEKFTSNQEEKVVETNPDDDTQKMHILLDAVREVLEEYVQKKHS